MAGRARGHVDVEPGRHRLGPEVDPRLADLGDGREARVHLGKLADDDALGPACWMTMSWVDAAEEPKEGQGERPGADQMSR